MQIFNFFKKKKKSETSVNTPVSKKKWIFRQLFDGSDFMKLNEHLQMCQY